MTHAKGGTMRIEILDTPSKSKGWGRYRVTSNGAPVVTSSTGNAWVSSSQVAALADGETLTVEMDVMLRVGKGYRSREERSQRTVTLIADAGETCTIDHRPGSQGIFLRFHGARIA